MPNKNITKIALFVILALGGSASFGCGPLGASDAPQAQDTADFAAPTRTGTLRSPDLTEASGVAASKCQPNVYWTHNDSGGGAFLFAIDGTGAHLGVWRVAGAKNKDWEDVAAFKDASGKCFVVIGDIGDNDLEREHLAVYRVREPMVDEASRSSTKASASETAPTEELNFRYPDVRRNAETLLVHPATGDVYVLTKSKREPISVYKLRPDYSGPEQLAQKIAEFTVPAVPNGLLTGGDISPDGKRIVLCDYVYGYELTLPALSASFDDIWKQRPLRFALGERGVGEAVAYTTDGDAVIAISEDPGTPVHLVERK